MEGGKENIKVRRPGHHPVSVTTPESEAVSPVLAHFLQEQIQDKTNISLMRMLIMNVSHQSYFF